MNFKTNDRLYTEAREIMQGQWGLAALTSFIYIVITMLLSEIPRIGNFSILIEGSFFLGYSYFIIALANRDNPRVEQLFEGFHDFIRSCVTYVLMIIIVLLWMLLLIIPGLMKAYSYSMVFYILAEDKKIAAMDALKQSDQLMYGHRMRLFKLNLKFLGWIILGIFTLGIAYFWLMPFMSVASYKFYEDLRDNKKLANLADHLIEN